MPYYIYTALNQEGKEVKGVEECYSIEDLERILHDKELVLISFKEGDASSKKKTRSMFRRKVDIDDVIAFLQTIASLIDSGVDLLQALKTSLRFVTGRFAEVISDIIKMVEYGSPFSVAVRATGFFPPNVYEPIAVGEETGRLGEVLNIIVHRLKEGRRLRERIKKASMYPTFVMVFVGMLSVLVFKFAFPKIVNSIKEVLAGREYPPVTKKIMIFAEFMTNWFPWIVLGLAGLIVGIYIGTKKSYKIKMIVDKMFLKVPHLSDMILFIQIIKSIQTLLISVQAGLPYLRGLELAKNEITNAVIAEAFNNIYRMVAMGSTLAEAFQANSLDPFLTTIVSAGEFTGRLEEMLGKLVEHYTERLEDKIDKFFAWLEPIIILFLGVIVATVLLCSLVPMWESMSYINKR